MLMRLVHPGVAKWVLGLFWSRMITIVSNVGKYTILKNVQIAGRIFSRGLDADSEVASANTKFAKSSVGGAGKIFYRKMIVEKYEPQAK